MWTKDKGRKTKGVNVAFVIRHSSFVWAVHPYLKGIEARATLAFTAARCAAKHALSVEDAGATRGAATIER